MKFRPGSHVHFVGIGGAGMSAIAKVLLERGVLVSGSDLKPSRAAAMLEAMGANVHIGHDASLIDENQTVVVSSAIPSTNQELRRAHELSVDVLARGEALAALLDGYRSIVVAGTHGKTTTTSMITTILRVAGHDPTYLIGGGLNDAGTNAKFGSSEFVVAESDESDASFLLLAPHIGIVTNVELDHVDRWRSVDELYDAFRVFVEKIESDGSVVVPTTDARLGDLARASGRRVVTFEDDGDVRAEDLVLGAHGTRFRIAATGGRADVGLRVPGRHNVSNALAAATACLEAGLGLTDIAAGLSAYRGVERRFQLRGRSDGVTVIDDYAHHPTEIRATLAAARPGPWERIVAVFQPHRYSRTAALASGFGASFDDADRVVVTEVYGAGEQPVPGVTGKLISDAVCSHIPGRPVAYLPHRADLIAYLTSLTRPGDVVLTMGAGDITTVGEELLARLEGSR